jgi:hypothetical protein
MAMYRIFQDGAGFGDRSGDAHELETAIAMAKQFSDEKNGANFIVEKVEKVFEVRPGKAPTSNAIHASIHEDDRTGQDEH